MGRKKLVRKAEPKRRRAWPRWTGFRGMTFRDWLQLLVVPLLLGLLAVGLTAWFNNQQAIRQQQIENQRAEAERELAEQRAQDEALQAYLDQMSGLLLERDLRASEEDSEVRTLARARTLTALERLKDPGRKTAVMQFLVEANLEQRTRGSAPILRLNQNAPFDVTVETGAALSGVTLSAASLKGVELRGADLRDAELLLVDLFEADLFGADLRDAKLTGADLSGADLGTADLRGADVDGVSWERTNLNGAELEGANLKGAFQLTLGQLASADSLEDATMPNGQKYEEWLNTPEGQQFREYQKNL